MVGTDADHGRGTKCGEGGGGEMSASPKSKIDIDNDGRCGAASGKGRVSSSNEEIVYIGNEGEHGESKEGRGCNPREGKRQSFRV